MKDINQVTVGEIISNLEKRIEECKKHREWYAVNCHERTIGSMKYYAQDSLGQIDHHHLYEFSPRTRGQTEALYKKGITTKEALKDYLEKFPKIKGIGAKGREELKDFVEDRKSMVKLFIHRAEPVTLK